MIEDIILQEYLNEKGYPQDSLIYRIFTDLNNLDVLSIRNSQNNSSIIIKYTKNKETLVKINSIVDDYFNNQLNEREKDIFPSFTYVKICSSLNLLETPRCPICGERVTLMGKSYKGENERKAQAFNKTCGDPKCIEEWIKLQSKEKYGTDYPQQSKEVKNKIEKTNIEKYGSKCVLQNAEVIKKSEITCLEKFGTKHASSSETIKNKIRQTNIENGFWDENSGKVKRVYKQTQKQKEETKLREENKRVLKSIQKFKEASLKKGYHKNDTLYKVSLSLIKNKLVTFNGKNFILISYIILK